MSTIEKPFINVAINSSGQVFANSGIDHRYSSLQEAAKNFGRDKAEMISDYSYVGRDTTRWFIAKLEVESTVAQKEKLSFQVLSLPAPVLGEEEEVEMPF